jgi:hypothetical protein
MELDEIKTLMPWFLDQQAKSDLYVDVKSLASGEINFSNYFVSSYGSMANEVSQGDILKEMPVISLPSVRVKNGLCMIIYNSFPIFIYLKTNTMIRKELYCLIICLALITRS